MDNVLSLQMLGTQLEQVCGQSGVSCPSNQSCYSQTSQAVKQPIGGGGGTVAAW